MAAFGEQVLTLEDIARRVVGDYLGVRAGETFLLVTDSTVDENLSDALLAAARETGVDPAHARIQLRQSSGEEPPPPVAAAMAAADVCLCIASRSIYHTEATGRAKASGTRGCFNAPTDLTAWTDGAMTADYLAIRKVAERLADRLRGAEWVSVTSPQAATSISASRDASPGAGTQRSSASRARCRHSPAARSPSRRSKERQAASSS